MGVGVDARLRADAIAGCRGYQAHIAATMPVPILGGILGGGVAAALYRDRCGAISFPLRGEGPPCFGCPIRAWCAPTGLYLSGAPAAHREF